MHETGEVTAALEELLRKRNAVTKQSAPLRKRLYALIDRTLAISRESQEVRRQIQAIEQPALDQIERKIRELVKAAVRD